MPKKLPHILISEDDFPTIRILSKALDEKHYSLELVCTTIETRNIALANFDLIILGTPLDTLHNLSITELLKTIQGKVPILQLLEKGSAVTKNKNITYLKKPFPQKQLLKKVENILFQNQKKK